MNDNSFWGNTICERFSKGHVKISNLSLDDQLAMIIPSNKLLIKTGWAYSAGDIIQINDIDINITRVEYIFWGLTAAPDYDPSEGYNAVLTIECDQMEKLREIFYE